MDTAILLLKVAHLILTAPRWRVVVICFLVLALFILIALALLILIWKKK